MRTTISTYFAPNKTIRGLDDLIKTGASDPLRDFGEAARAELQALTSSQCTDSEVRIISRHGSFANFGIKGALASS